MCLSLLVSCNVGVKVDVERRLGCGQSQPCAPLRSVLGPHLGLAEFPTMDTFERHPTCNCFQYTDKIYKPDNHFKYLIMKVAAFLALIPAAFAVINNEVCTRHRPPLSSTLANCMVASQDRSRHTRRVQPQDHRRRQDQRALPRHPRGRRQRIRCLIQPRPAIVLHGWPGTGYQGLGPGSFRYVCRREEEAHHPAGLGLWLARSWPHPRQQRLEYVE